MLLWIAPYMQEGEMQRARLEGAIEELAGSAGAVQLAFKERGTEGNSLA